MHFKQTSYKVLYPKAVPALKPRAGLRQAKWYMTVSTVPTQEAIPEESG